jgi:hypothetical protein
MNVAKDDFHTRSDDRAAQARLGSIAHTFRMLGDIRLLSFLRWAREPDIFACSLINKALDQGAGLEVLAGDGGEWGYVLEASEAGENRYRIRFGCVEGREAGDGGTWLVTFDDAGRVAEGRLEGAWIN